jgi:hypothetical protein
LRLVARLRQALASLDEGDLQVSGRGRGGPHSIERTRRRLERRIADLERGRR